jgi:hypothetical protein
MVVLHAASQLAVWTGREPLLEVMWEAASSAGPERSTSRGHGVAMPTTGLLRVIFPVEPSKAASPKVKMPPSEATSQ